MRRGLLFALSLSLAACKPDLDDRVSVVTAPRVLAVRAEPAEAAPDTDVSYSALVVGASGTIADPPIDWSRCTARKPLAELGPVAAACVRGDDGALLSLGVGARVASRVPADACRQFGPDVPEAKAGEPAGRPVDPDPTGGYYEPLRVALDGDVTVVRSRIACGLPGATAEQLVDFRTRYRLNTNPVVDALSGAEGGIAAGTRVVLRASWAGCADEPAACSGAEAYVTFDLEARANVVRREAMRVAWYASAGGFDLDRTGRASDDRETFSENGFTAPSTPGRVHLWLVLRDDRGGVGWRETDILVR